MSTLTILVKAVAFTSDINVKGKVDIFTVCTFKEVFTIELHRKISLVASVSM